MPKPLPNGLTRWEPANLMLPFVNAQSTMQLPFSAMASFNGMLCESLAHFSTEWVGFLNRRLKEDWAVLQRIAACTSPQELQRVYVDYWSKAFAQYQEELGRLARLGETVTHQTASALQRQMQAMMHETQLAA